MFSSGNAGLLPSSFLSVLFEGVRPHSATGLWEEHVYEWLLFPPRPESPAAPTLS